MSEFASLVQRQPKRGGLTKRLEIRAVLSDPTSSHGSPDTIGHENDSWAGVAIGWWGGEP
ncbi:hypothetical protein GCM10028793_47650 [Nocardiopsis oceani]